MSDSIFRRMSAILPSAVRANIYAMKLRLFPQRGYTTKQRAVLSYLSNHAIDCFIESGTFRGDMVNAVRPFVKNAFSIELDDFLFRVNRLRFLRCENVSILHGDSGQILEALLPTINERCVFWLDGHFSGDGTAKGKLETPILAELAAIGNHRIKNHTILVDDARFFGSREWPSLSELRELIHGINNNYDVEVHGDILRAEVKG